MFGQMDPGQVLNFIQQKKSADAERENREAMVALKNQFARGLTIDSPEGDNVPHFVENTVSVIADASSEETTVNDITADDTVDGVLINKIKITPGTNTSVESIVIDDLTLSAVVTAGGSEVTVDVKDIFGDFVYAAEKIAVVASNGISSAEDITVTVQGFKN